MDYRLLGGVLPMKIELVHAKVGIGIIQNGCSKFLPHIYLEADTYKCSKFLFMNLQDLIQKLVAPPTVSAAPGPCITMDANTPVRKLSASSDFRSKLRRVKSRSAFTYWLRC